MKNKYKNLKMSSIGQKYEPPYRNNQRISKLLLDISGTIRSTRNKTFNDSLRSISTLHDKIEKSSGLSEEQFDAYKVEILGIISPLKKSIRDISAREQDLHNLKYMTFPVKPPTYLKANDRNIQNILELLWRIEEGLSSVAVSWKYQSGERTPANLINEDLTLNRFFKSYTNLFNKTAVKCLDDNTRLYKKVLDKPSLTIEEFHKIKTEIQNNISPLRKSRFDTFCRWRPTATHEFYNEIYDAAEKRLSNLEYVKQVGAGAGAVAGAVAPVGLGGSSNALVLCRSTLDSNTDPLEADKPAGGFEESKGL